MQKVGHDMFKCDVETLYTVEYMKKGKQLPSIGMVVFHVTEFKN